MWSAHWQRNLGKLKQQGQANRVHTFTYPDQCSTNTGACEVTVVRVSPLGCPCNALEAVPAVVLHNGSQFARGLFGSTLQPNNTLLNLSAVLLNPVRLALDGLKHMLMHQGAPRTESKPHRLLEPLLGQPGVSESQEDLSCFVVSPRCEPAVTYRQHPHTQLYKSHKVSRNLGWNTGCIQTPCNVYVYL